MKRMLLCPPCALKLHASRGLKPAHAPFSFSDVLSLTHSLVTGETTKIVKGRSHAIILDCDTCNARIDPFGDCAAVSIYSNEIPYYEWESSYLDSDMPWVGDDPDAHMRGQS